MHELSIVFSIIDQVEEIAKDNNVSEVTALTLQIGEVSMVIPSYLEDCYNWAIQKSAYMKNCKLTIEMIEGITYCEDCQKTYKTTEFGKTCPHCQSERTYLIQGNETNIKEIEVV